MKCQSREIDIILQQLWNFDRWITCTTADIPAQFQSDHAIFNINITASILQETWGQLFQTITALPGRMEKWLQDPFLQTGRGHPPLFYLCPIIVETLLPQNLLHTAVTSPQKVEMFLLGLWAIFVLIFHEGRLYLPALYKCEGMIWNVNLF